jgi:hypothetical protein
MRALLAALAFAPAPFPKPLTNNPAQKKMAKWSDGR